MQMLRVCAESMDMVTWLEEVVSAGKSDEISIKVGNINTTRR